MPEKQNARSAKKQRLFFRQKSKTHVPRRLVHGFLESLGKVENDLLPDKMLFTVKRSDYFNAGCLERQTYKVSWEKGKLPDLLTDKMFYTMKRAIIFTLEKENLHPAEIEFPRE